MSATERVLRETLREVPQLPPSAELLEQATRDGRRIRRRRRRQAVALSVAMTLGIVGVGAAMSPHLLPRPLVVRPAAGGGTLHVDPTLQAVDPTVPQAPVPVLRPQLWTEHVAGHDVSIVATYDGHRLCVQPDNPDDVAVHRPVCAGPAPAQSGLVAGPVGGAGGVRQADATLRRLVVLAQPAVTDVVAHVPGGDVYLAYLQVLHGWGGANLFQVVMPASQRVLSLELFDGARHVGRWRPSR